MTHSGHTVNIYEAKAHLSQLVELSGGGRGDHHRQGREAAAPSWFRCRKERPPAIYGAWRNKVYIADDFDDPLPDDIQPSFDGDRTK